MKRIVCVLFSLIMINSMVLAKGAGDSGGEEAASGAMTIMPVQKIDYTDLETAQAYTERGPVVLFFFAAWCPTCQMAMTELNESIGSLDDDITVIVVNYDKETALKDKYGIVVQHTFVQIDAEGTKKAVWSGGSIADINENVVRK